MRALDVSMFLASVCWTLTFIGWFPVAVLDRVVLQTKHTNLMCTDWPLRKSIEKGRKDEDYFVHICHFLSEMIILCLIDRLPGYTRLNPNCFQNHTDLGFPVIRHITSIYGDY